MQKSLIVGASGFVGNHLARHLISTGWTVHGFDRVSSLNMDMEIIEGDLFNRALLAQMLADIKPQVIFHLAGILKSDQPELLYRIHVLGTETLCDAVLEAGIKPLIIVASSSAVYGAGREAKPITEGFRPRPVTHYGISKLAQELISFRYYHVFGLPVICVRSFNIIGPGQPPSLACSSFARQIALAELHGDNSVTTGDLSAQRDFVDVRDVARAYEMTALHGRVGQVYNVSSGRTVSIRECLDELLKLTPRPFQIISNVQQAQKMDVSIQLGSAERLRKHSGWQPRISLPSSLADLLDYWRRMVQSEIGTSSY